MGGNTRLNVKGLRAVESGRMALCRGKSPALLGEHMHQNWPLHPLGRIENSGHGTDVMTVHRPKISNAHVFKKHAGDHQLLKTAFGPAKGVDSALSPFGAVESIVYSLLQVQIAGGSADIIQILGHASHIFGDGHVVVIEHNDKVGLQFGGIVQRLICHAPCEGSIPYDRDYGILPSIDIPGFHKPQPCGDGGRAVPCFKGITVTFFSLGKTT